MTDAELITWRKTQRSQPSTAIFYVLRIPDRSTHLGAVMVRSISPSYVSARLLPVALALQLIELAEKLVPGGGPNAHHIEATLRHNGFDPSRTYFTTEASPPTPPLTIMDWVNYRLNARYQPILEEVLALIDQQLPRLMEANIEVADMRPLDYPGYSPMDGPRPVLYGVLIRAGSKRLDTFWPCSDQFAIDLIEAVSHSNPDLIEYAFERHHVTHVLIGSPPLLLTPTEYRRRVLSEKSI